MSGRGGKEGDWECKGCRNRNYAFRSLCNRCKQPRVFVDHNTPPNSNWLPRIGDWVCTGCTNNNYASRANCKKCGQLKEVAALPAIAFPDRNLQRLTPSSPWLPPGGSLVPQANVPADWRSGDWVCNCGFHNYSSRTQCKKCNAAPPASGIKRLAPADLLHDLDIKRQNAGIFSGLNPYVQPYPGFGRLVGLYGTYNGSPAVPPSMQGQMHIPELQAVPALMGKGAKQWRDGDWMCSNCNNHNYASRSECNRCKTQKTALSNHSDVYYY